VEEGVMPMAYPEVRRLTRNFGFDEVHRNPRDGGEEAQFAGKVLIPFAFPYYPVFLENGDDSIIEDEVVEGLLRFIEDQLGHKIGGH
jgi:hypothetical protein